VAQFEFDCFEGRPTTRCCVVCKSKNFENNLHSPEGLGGPGQCFCKTNTTGGEGCCERDFNNQALVQQRFAAPMGGIVLAIMPAVGPVQTAREVGSENGVRMYKSRKTMQVQLLMLTTDGCSRPLPGYKGRHEAEPTWRQTRRNLPGRDRRLPRSVPATACSIRWENTVLSAG
jgi:hypothetical protein